MKCRMRSRADEKINHIVRDCPKFAQKEYKRRHDWTGRCIEQMGLMLNQNDMSINQIRSLRVTLVKTFAVFLYIL